ncbi:MAG: hypothetical protein WD773_07990 [Gemmatimonadales bacterium]
MTLLDDFAPKWQFREIHAIAVLATPERAYRAIETVTAGEIRLFRALTWFRRLGRVGPESILNAPPDQPILDVATRSGFLLLAAEPPKEIVVGTVVVAPPGVPRPMAPRQFKDINEPGYAKAVMNFRIDRAGLAILLVDDSGRQRLDSPHVAAGDQAKS